MNKRIFILYFILIPLAIMTGDRSYAEKNLPTITHVLIITTDKGYTVYFGLTDQLDKSKFEEFKKKAAGKKNMQVIVFDAMVKSPDAYILKYIKENYYPNIDVAKGLSELIKRGFASDGLGLTWNGGIALTHNDFSYAQKTYGSYLVNPKDKNLRKARNLDPVHPQNHLRLLDEEYMKKLLAE